MGRLVDIGKLSNINWGREYLWSVIILGIPAPFDRFFPAISVEESLSTLDSNTFTIGTSTFSIPQSSGELSLKIEYVDDENNTLDTFFTDWQRSCKTASGRIKTLDLCIKDVTIEKFSGTDNEISNATYKVYPRGDLNYNGTSESNVVGNSVELVVVGSNIIK